VQLGRIVGSVVATVKDPKLTGLKLLLVQPIAPDGTDAGRPLVAADSIGAGADERVFFVRGTEASFPFDPASPPADAAVVGIVDEWDRP
jgi:microcompartment protein CcmK/EutM